MFPDKKLERLVAVPKELAFVLKIKEKVYLRNNIQ